MENRKDVSQGPAWQLVARMIGGHCRTCWTPRILKGNVFDVTFTRLRDAGLPVINRRIPFPANGDEFKFAGAFAQALKQPPPPPPELSI